MDYICQAKEATEHIPTAKPPPHPGNLLAGQGAKCRGSCLVQVSPACSPCSNNADSAGLDTSTKCSMVASPQLRFRDVVKRETKVNDLNTESWENLAADRYVEGRGLSQQLKAGEEKLVNAAAEKRQRRKERSNSNRPVTMYTCDLCNTNCHSRIGLFRRKRRCSSRADSTDN